MAGITSSLNTALSGLATSQQQIGVVGNNIANVNTVGFKASALDFKTQFLQNFSFGSAPSGNLGGTNPLQIGLGATSGAITKNFSDGSLEATGVNTNLAIQGNGFFVLRQGTQQVYTRDGSFQLNGLNQLVSGTGQLVQGFTVDNNYNIIPGTLTNITVPVGAASVAQATTNVNISGQLDANGNIPTQVAQLNTPLYLTNGSGGISATRPASTDLLTNLTDVTGKMLFNNGDVITLTATEGTSPANAASATTRTITETFTVTGTSTLDDLRSFMEGALGINTMTGANPSPLPAPGVTLTADGTDPKATDLFVVGNPGTGNDITLDQNSLLVKDSTGTATGDTFTWNKTSAADGESVYTTTNVFDSLGNTLNLNIVVSLLGKSSTGTTWQVYAASPDGTPSGAQLKNSIGLGTLTFDGNGNLLSSTTPSVTIDRSNTGAIPNLQFKINFSGVQAQGPTNGVTQDNSQLNATADGAIPGVLKTFSIGPDGIITGAFSNGLNRTVGQVVLATFQNNEGLVDEGGNTYIAGPNSGNAIITTPGSLSAGKITAGSLEGSNVDLSTEFVKLIAASTAFSASSRVITSSNQLLQDLLSAAR
ncbi:MAG: flagellar hook-basal body complex protein [Phycisphaerae bacterium]